MNGRARGGNKGKLKAGTELIISVLSPSRIKFNRLS